MKNNTINKKEIEKFSKIAEEWWNPEGKFKPLHKFNPIRISYIKEKIISSFKLENSDKPLQKIRLLDIGCGEGDFLSKLDLPGLELWGLEQSEYAAKKASEKGLKIINDKIENISEEKLSSSPPSFPIASTTSDWGIPDSFPTGVPCFFCNVTSAKLSAARMEQSASALSSLLDVSIDESCAVSRQKIRNIC